MEVSNCSFFGLQASLFAMSSSSLPHALVTWFDGWGAKLKATVDLAMQQAWQQAGCFDEGRKCHVPTPLLVGTDCSGIEAPIHALRGLGVEHSHRWSWEIAEGPREVLLANTPPVGPVYHDVLDALAQGPRSKVQGPRSRVQGPASKKKPEYVHLYVAGFSCKPFSTLHHQSKLLDEPQAQIFWAVVARIHAVRPACFVLENVMGIFRVLPEVVKALEGDDGRYYIIVQKMDPVELQEPLRRPRVFFLGVRKDLAKTEPSVSEKVVAGAWDAVRGYAACQPHVSLEERLLPADHAAVVKHQDFRRERWVKAVCGKNQCLMTCIFNFSKKWFAYVPFS